MATSIYKQFSRFFQCFNSDSKTKKQKKKKSKKQQKMSLKMECFEVYPLSAVHLYKIDQKILHSS